MLREISYPSVSGKPHIAKVVVNNPREKIQSKWMNGNFYETQRYGMLNYAYKKYHGGTFIDIGAAIGNHSLFFAICCRAERVIAFEPMPRLFEHLNENIRLNSLENVKTINAALGEQKSEIGMVCRDLPIEQGGMLVNQVDEGGHGYQMEKLDDIIKNENLREIQCIKIDVEGYSLPVLKGASHTLRTYKPAIFCECETREKFEEVNDYLAGLGYRVWNVSGKPFVMNHTDTYLWEHESKIEITIVIATYNRPNQLRSLLRRLMGDCGQYRVRCLIYNDGSDLEYSDIPRGNAQFVINYFDDIQHHGKEGYWRLMNRIYQDLKDTSSSYYIQLPDDVLPKRGFLSDTINTYEAIQDKNKICLNLYLDESRIGKKNWGSKTPSIERYGDVTVFLSGWVDMIYFAEHNFFQQLNFTINPVPKDRWERNPQLSSGVGLQITKRLRKFNMYQVRRCLLEASGVGSQMHPNRPRDVDLSVAELDPIMCGVASVPQRSENLRLSVVSILPYVDELHVFLNDYPQVPTYLIHPKITTYRSQDYGNLGDAGKFFSVGTKSGYYLAIDDDIIYPEDFVWRMLAELRGNKKQGRRVVVGLHGRVMADKVNHYYRDHKNLYHCARTVKNKQSVHIIGTGAVAFHTGDLQITINDFKGPKNMADIHFSIACQRQNVGCIVLPHSADYLTIQKIPSQDTIWGQSRTNDDSQTKLLNSWKHWELRV